jgi:hypothetical protein
LQLKDSLDQLSRLPLSGLDADAATHVLCRDVALSPKQLKQALAFCGSRDATTQLVKYLPLALDIVNSAMRAVDAHEVPTVLDRMAEFGTPSMDQRDQLWDQLEVSLGLLADDARNAWLDIAMFIHWRAGFSWIWLERAYSSAVLIELKRRSLLGKDKNWRGKEVPVVHDIMLALARRLCAADKQDCRIRVMQGQELSLPQVR